MHHVCKTNCTHIIIQITSNKIFFYILEDCETPVNVTELERRQAWERIVCDVIICPILFIQGRKLSEKLSLAQLLFRLFSSTVQDTLHMQ